MTAIVLDTETTGLNKETDRIVEIGIISWQDGSKLMLQRLNPGISIPSEVTAIHGIGDDDVADSPGFEAIAGDLKGIIERAEAVIGYHIFYDYDMVTAEFNRLGIKVEWPTLVCAKRVWDVYEPREERHLHNAFRRFVDRRGFENAHSALADINATRDVLMGQIDAFGLHDLPWENFDPERRFWWGPSSHIILTQNGELRVAFGKHKGIDVHMVDTGFWRWVTTKDFPDHVMLLALQMIELDREVTEVKRQKIFTWALDYKSRKF